MELGIVLGRHAKHRQNRRNLVSVCKSRLAVLTIPSCCGQSPSNVHCSALQLRNHATEKNSNGGVANGHRVEFESNRGKSTRFEYFDRG